MLFRCFESCSLTPHLSAYGSTFATIQRGHTVAWTTKTILCPSLRALQVGLLLLCYRKWEHLLLLLSFQTPYRLLAERARVPSLCQLARAPKTRLLIGHTPGQWLPTAFAACVIFRGQSQNFSLYHSGCFVGSGCIIRNYDALFSIGIWVGLQ